MSELETRAPEFGERETKTLRYDQLEVLPQIRKKMDSEKLADLATSIDIDTETGAARLINPITVNALDEEHYGQYVLENAAFFDHEVGEVAGLHIPGVHYVVIAGHRRRVATGMKAGFDGVPIENVTMPVSLRFNMPFTEAFKLQLRENNHDRPATQDEAAEVAKYVEARRREDSNISLSQCARELGWTSDRLRAACKYNELPEKVRDAVEDKLITFTNAVDLWNLLAAYRLKGRHLMKNSKFPSGFDDIESYAAYELETKTQVLIGKRMIGTKSQADTKKVIDGWVNTIKPTEYEQEEFMLILDDTPEVRRKNASRDLMRTALNALRFAMTSGDIRLTPDDVQTLASLYAALPRGTNPGEQLAMGDIA